MTELANGKDAAMTAASHTSSGIAYERSGPRGEPPLVLVHAGVADRRMWDPQWHALIAERDVVRLDLRGFGSSTILPDGPLSPVADLLALLDELGIVAAHLVGASFGAGVVVEAALTRPAAVLSLLLVGPGGSLIAEATPDLQDFFVIERAALAAGDLDAAVEANLVAWVDGPTRTPDAVDPAVRAAVRMMQRRAFDIGAAFDDVEEAELEPPVLERLDEIGVRTLVLVGGLDVAAIRATATLLVERIAGSRRVDWDNTAHLPSMERPADFLSLLRGWLVRGDDDAER